MAPKTTGRLVAFTLTLLMTGALAAAPPAAGGAPGASVGATGASGDDTAPPGNRGAEGRKDGKARPGGAPGTDLLSSDSESTAARKIAREESKLERRKAKIARLRELAQAQGNEQRLRALDDLERRMIAGHERKMAKWRERLGDERFGKARAKVKQRRGRGQSAEHGKPDDAGKSADQGKPDDAGRPAERGKPADAGKPAETGKGSRGRGAADPAAGTDRGKERKADKP